VKRIILGLIERCGYVVLKIPHYRCLQSAFAEAEDRRAEAEGRRRVAEAEVAEAEGRVTQFGEKMQQVERELANTNLEFRRGRERDTRELEEARAETWRLTERSRDFERQLSEALDEIRRLKIRIEEIPEIDYQVLMREQHERAAFQDAEPAFMELYEKVRHFSMTSIERLYAMYKAIEHICRTGIPGSIVECGVWRGGSMMMAALTLQMVGDTSRQLYLFDTYEGLPKPNETEDIDLWGHSAYNEWTRHRLTDESSAWAAASLEEVEANLISTGYPRDKLNFVKGMVQSTLPNTSIDAIALLRLDTDWYESTVCELNHLYPHVAEGGVLIVDDYGHFHGQRKAVDEYLAQQKQQLLLNRIDYSGRLAVKVGQGPTNGRVPG